MKKANRLIMALTLVAPAVTYLVAVAAAYWVAVAPMAPAVDVAMLPVMRAVTPAAVAVAGGCFCVRASTSRWVCQRSWVDLRPQQCIRSR